MTSPSSSNPDEKVYNEIVNLEKAKQYSVMDECWVSQVKCDTCDRSFYELLESARLYAVCGVPYRCILCVGPAPDKRMSNIVVAGMNALW